MDEYKCIECGELCDVDGLCGYCQSEYAGYYDYGDDIAFSDLSGNSTLRVATDAVLAGCGWN